MIEHARPHPTASCACGRAPLQVHTTGTHPTVHLECPRCGLRTARLGTAESALADWNAGQLQPIRSADRTPLSPPAALGSARSLADAERERSCLALFDRTPRMAAA